MVKKAKTKAKRKEVSVWVARSKNADFLGCKWYNLYIQKNKPVLDEDDQYRGAEEYFCIKLFERVTGFKLKPGECQKVRIKIQKVRNG